MSSFHPRDLLQVGHGWSVDIVGSATAADRSQRQVQVAVETDGPVHFAKNLQSHQLGTTRIRNKCIQALGYTLVTVPFQGDDALPQDPGPPGDAKRVKYLKARLAAALGTKP